MDVWENDICFYIILEDFHEFIRDNIQLAGGDTSQL